jgi:hypothetical protein
MPGLNLLRPDPEASRALDRAVASIRRAQARRWRGLRSLLFEHDLFRKPAATFRDHALEHPKHLRPYRYGGEKQAQRGQRDRFFQD